MLKIQMLLISSFMSKVQQLQDELKNYEEFSQPLSYIEFISVNQALKQDGSKYYVLPQRRDLGRISSFN